jgi:hypothetical protein
MAAAGTSLLRLVTARRFAGARSAAIMDFVGTRFPTMKNADLRVGVFAFYATLLPVNSA